MQRLRNFEETCSCDSAIMQINAMINTFTTFLRGVLKWTPPIQANRAVFFFAGRTSEKFSCLFLFLFSFFVFLPKFLVLGPIRPVPIVPGNFWLFEQLSEVLVTSSNFLPFWAIFEFRAHIKHERINDFIEKFYLCEILQRIKRGFSSLEND